VRVLLDTHALIWAVDDVSRLGTVARDTIEDTANDALVSVATIWEMSIKVGLGKLSLSMPYRQWMENALNQLGAQLVPITLDAADVQATLPMHHRDPFDRLMIAQAIVQGLEVVSEDQAFDAYGINRIW
jgi:PIN domain nuclease of toxin-antitoxin system